MILAVVLSQVLGGCHRSHADKCARVYFHDHCTGLSRSVGLENQRFIGHFWNDQVSSVVVRKGCQFHVYEHHNFKGRDLVFRGTKTRLRDIGRKVLWFKRNHWNDRISSWKCTCESTRLRELLTNMYVGIVKHYG